MRTGDLLFIFLILVIGCIGGLVAIASQSNPTTGADTFGSATTENVNRTSELVTNVQVAETEYSGVFLLFAAIGVVIMLIIGIMLTLKKSGLGRGKYRTG
jgi:hypothetical protein